MRGQDVDNLVSAYIRDLPSHFNLLYRNIKVLTNKEKQKIRAKTLNDKTMSTKEGHIKLIASARKCFANKSNTPFTVTLKYLISIAPEVCPVFGEPLLWATRSKRQQPFSPSLDKICPELGYIEGNVQWLSLRANIMKHNASPIELKQFAEWVLKQSVS